MVANIPDHVTDTVSVLLEKYGVDFKSVMADARKNFGKTSQRYITASQAHAYCGLAASTIREKVRDGEIKSIRLGKTAQSRVLIDKDSLDAWLESFSQNQ